MSTDQKYEILGNNTKIHCKTRNVYIGDTFIASEVLKPTILEGLVACGKIKEIESTPKPKSEPKSKLKSTEEKSDDKPKKKSSKKSDDKKSD